jgi:hypothetical protein
MTIKTQILCDGCHNLIETDTTDSIDELLNQYGWQHDPITEEYQYCNKCHPQIQAEHDESKVVSV